MKSNIDDADCTVVTYNHWTLVLPGKWRELIGRAQTIDLRKIDSDSTITFTTFLKSDGAFGLQEMEEMTKKAVGELYTVAKRTNPQYVWTDIEVYRDPDPKKGVCRAIGYNDPKYGKQGFFIGACARNRLMKAIARISDGPDFANQCRKILAKSFEAD